MISASTKLPAPAFSPNTMTSLTLHSKLIGASFTLDGAMLSDFTSVNPAFLNSFTPLSKLHDERDICCPIFSFTIATTHSLFFIILSKVCLFVPWRILVTGEKIIIGGFTENTLKNEKGDKLLLPLLSIVLTKAIGLGVIADDR